MQFMNMNQMIRFLLIGVLSLLLFTSCNHPDNKNVADPLRIVVELNIGESRIVQLHNKKEVKVTLEEINEIRDSVRNAIRDVRVKIDVDGKKVILNSGNYNLPVSVGEIAIDCPVTGNYIINSNRDSWSLGKDARLRIWSRNTPFIKKGTFVYPVKQKLFANMTQSGNEPSWLAWGEDFNNRSIYYHNGHDIGGAEGMDEIISATDGVVLSSRNQVLDDHSDFPGDVRKDVVYIRDERGWYYRYSHFDSIYDDITPGRMVKMGDKLGLIGKQGGSGGWVHLHFGISYKDSSRADWKTEDAFVYVWEAYLRQYKPELVAIARPHQLLWVNQETTLDGSRSRGIANEIVTYEWILSNQTNASGPTHKMKYELPGTYSEILKITDSKGNTDYDFMLIQVLDRADPKPVPVLQSAYYPTLNIKKNDSVRFFVRAFNTDIDSVAWYFGDGSTPVKVETEKAIRQEETMGRFTETRHAFAEAGHYIVKAENCNASGIKSTAHLHVVVEN